MAMVAKKTERRWWQCEREKWWWTLSLALLIHIDLATREEGPSRKSTVDLNQNSTDI